jgi:thioredoxin-disulfide reductase
MIYELIIIGGGPAGITGGIYAARKQLKTLLLTKDFEGEIFNSPKVENYPGFEEISGAELSRKFKKHLLRFSSLDREPEPGEIKIKEDFVVQKISEKENLFEIETENKEKFISKSVIIATGASPRKLEVPGAKEFEGRGVAFCETCDGPFFKDKNVAIIGGGNAGLEAAEELAEYTKKVYILESREQLPGDALLVGRLKQKDNIEIITNIEIKEIKGSNFVEKILYFDKNENKGKEVNISGIFVKIGQVPNSSFVKDFLELNEKGEIIVDPRNLATSRKGIFAAGDVTNILYKQYVISAGEGAKAALSVYQFLNSVKKEEPASQNLVPRPALCGARKKNYAACFFRKFKN